MKTLSKTIGIILLMLPFAGWFGYVIWKEGLLTAVTCLSVVVALLVCIFAGLYFLTKKD